MGPPGSKLSRRGSKFHIGDVPGTQWVGRGNYAGEGIGNTYVSASGYNGASTGGTITKRGKRG